MKTVDLHVHSTASDGTCTPTELIRLASGQHLAAIALTDHDSVSGIPEAKAAGARAQIEVVPGIELSTEYHGSEIHMVGHFIDDTNPLLNEQIRSFREKRDGRNLKIIGLLQKKGFDISAEEVRKRNPDSVIARPHIARYLVDTGQMPDIKTVFDQYIAEGRDCFVGREMITPMKAVELIHAAGGAAILAHPVLYTKMSPDEKIDMIQKLTECGLDGMEVMYSRNKEGDEAYYRSIADRFHLLYSGGSDFHGANKPDIHLGTGTGNLCIPYVFLEKIRQRVSDLAAS